MKVVIYIVLGFLAGFALRHFIPFDTSIETHWNAVNEYNDYIRNPSNYQNHSNGIAGTTPPYEIEPHLAYLVAENELRHDDLILPKITETKETTLHWMRFCDKHHDDIIQATSPCIPEEQGWRPVHLNIWYKPSAQYLVDQLVDELKEIGEKVEVANAKE